MNETISKMAKNVEPGFRSAEFWRSSTPLTNSGRITSMNSGEQQQNGVRFTY